VKLDEDIIQRIETISLTHGESFNLVLNKILGEYFNSCVRLEINGHNC